MLDRKSRFSVKNSKSEFRAKHPDGDKYETMTEIKNIQMTKTLNFQWVRFGPWPRPYTSPILSINNVWGET